jgi:hypothetical protein
MSIVIWKEDEIARILVVDDEKDSVVVVRDMTTLSKHLTDRCIGCSQQFLS